jgi:hypothetical protein
MSPDLKTRPARRAPAAAAVLEDWLVLRHFLLWTLALWLALLLPAVPLAISVAVFDGSHALQGGWVMAFAYATMLVLAVKAVRRLLEMPPSLTGRSAE